MSGKCNDSAIPQASAASVVLWRSSVVNIMLTTRTEPHMARIGRDSIEMIGELLESASLWLFTERLGKTAAEVAAINNAARVELGDTSLQLYVPM